MRAALLAALLLCGCAAAPPSPPEDRTLRGLPLVPPSHFRPGLCPVSHRPLGPTRKAIIYRGAERQFCCQSCVRDFLKEAR